MNISTDFKAHSPAEKLSGEGYEWWYFDGQSHDSEYHFVIIFYHSNPFSVNNIKELSNGKFKNPAPAISVSLYRKSKPVYYSFLEYEESSFHWDEQEMELRVGDDLFNYRPKEQKLLVNLRLDQKLDSGHFIKGSLKAEGSWPNPQLIHSENDDRHAWNLIMPRMDWEVDIETGLHEDHKVVQFKGIGYHDHNVGQEPMKDSFKDWYWGRYHFEEFTLVYYLMNKHQEEQMEAWLIDHDNKTVLEYFTDQKLSYFSRNVFGLHSAKKIELNSNQASVNIQYRNKIDNGPFYERFQGNAILRYNDEVIAAQGISEYIYPENIYNSLFWPLVNMRLRYMYKDAHWVQKSSLMYPWTW
ncbi:hypothetical protein [Gracilimonas tropica]|uniref:hypothetical protein n=1 Tax=Gracilimonas tropica TaxID=454600 RepID=UPI0003736A30|nr:hypothetical protein [Gracilimonas tropica]